MENYAATYDEVSKPQYETGCELIDKLNISRGAKVLDMGCGTGRISKYIADIVGPDGQVVAVDPDEDRIKIAQGQYKDVGHLQFHVGTVSLDFHTTVKRITTFTSAHVHFIGFHMRRNLFMFRKHINV